MMEDWEEIKLGDVVDIGSSKRIYAADYVENGIPFYRSKEVIETYRGREISLELFISEEKYNLIKEKYGVPQIGDILITSVGTIGVPLVIKQNESFYFKDGNLIWVKTSKVEDRLDPSYFYFFLDSAYGQAKLDSVLIGSSQKALTISGLNRLKINLPPIPIQHKIASILSAYDDLIENNLKRIKLLEEKAQLTYEEWFVRMKFPGHETTPINKETGLPEGWEKVKLNEILKFNQGVQVPIDKQLKEKNTERVRFIRIVDVTQGAQEERFIETPRKNQMVIEKDLFMVRYGAPQVVTNFKGAIANNFFKINIIDSSKVFPKYVYCFLDRKEIREYLMGVSVSATMPAISFKSFGQIKMMLPERNLQKKFHDYVDSIFELILDFEKQNKLLKEARDILLPRLMTGMIDVEQMNLENLQPTTA